MSILSLHGEEGESMGLLHDPQFDNLRPEVSGSCPKAPLAKQRKIMSGMWVDGTCPRDP